ncbi:hypothetical protein [Pelagibacterium xiamenense]|uniref:hypothetical protein n=1 Tax=Pelagibacterium xiamenense TaxID=2901140 RepID=UPI001E5A7AEC|nr:hypothetical protein [Pelagibacterium xiamenense]MCD7059673.1 hypothetical protein [Pelagibacterium xiamenense]
MRENAGIGSTVMNFNQDMLQLVPVGLIAAVIVICGALVWSIGARRRSGADADGFGNPDALSPQVEPGAPAAAPATTIDTRERVRSFISELKALEN